MGLRRGEVRLVLLADDSSERDRERLIRVAAEEEIPTRIVGSRAELGAAVGRDQAAVLGIRDAGMADALAARLSGTRGAVRKGRAPGGNQR